MSAALERRYFPHRTGRCRRVRPRMDGDFFTDNKNREDAVFGTLNCASACLNHGQNCLAGGDNLSQFAYDDDNAVTVRRKLLRIRTTIPLRLYRCGSRPDRAFARS